MKNEPVFVSTIEDMEREHNETLADAQCRSHSVGRCPDCVEDICPLCEGSGVCVVAAVDHPDSGVLYVEDREIKVPCVLCKATSGEHKRFSVGTEKVVRLYRTDGELFATFAVLAGESHETQFAIPYLLGRIQVLEEGVG